MSEYNVRINVKSDTGYDQLYPKSKSDIIDFDKTNSNLVSTNVEGAIKEINNKINSTSSIANANKTNIGTLKNLTTDSKTNLVGAINEVDSHANTATTTANTNKTNIGTLSSLKTSVKNSIVNAINWLYDNVVRKTSVVDNLDDIVANQANGMVAGAKAVATLNADLAELSAKTAGYVYSTEEQIIGKWIDGRNLYRKVFNIGNLNGSGGVTTRTHGITNFDRAIHLYGSARNTETSSRYTIGLPYPETSGATDVYVSLQAHSTNVTVYHPNDFSRYSAVVVMEYIKTAD